MTRNARKRALAVHKAAGTYVPRRPHRSHYLTVDIRDAVHSDLEAMRVQLEAQRGIGDPRVDVTPLEPAKKRRERAPDPHWAFRPAGTAERAVDAVLGEAQTEARS